MSKNILVTIQETDENLDSFLNYAIGMARDFNFGIELISSSEKFVNNPEPLAITGTGLPLPKILRKEKIKEKNAHHLQTRLNLLMETGVNISYEISKLTAQERLLSSTPIKDVDLILSNQPTIDKNFINLFELYNGSFLIDSYIPQLVIPHESTYVKPRKILVLFGEQGSQNIKDLKPLSEKMGIRLLFLSSSGLTYKQFLSDQFTNGEIVDNMQLFNSKKFKDYLDEIIEKHEPDWLAISKVDRLEIAKFYESNSEELMHKINIPVINF